MAGRPARSTRRAALLLALGLLLATPIGLAAHQAPDGHTTSDGHAELSMAQDGWTRHTEFGAYEGILGIGHDICFQLTNVHDQDPILFWTPDPWRILDDEARQVSPNHLGVGSWVELAPGDTWSGCWDGHAYGTWEEDLNDHLGTALPGTYHLVWDYRIDGQDEDRTIGLRFTVEPWCPFDTLYGACSA